MGKGDKKSKRGKICIGSYGVSRKRNKKAATATIPVADKKAKVKKEVIAPAETEDTVKKVTVKKAAVKKVAPKKEDKTSEI